MRSLIVFLVVTLQAIVPVSAQSLLPPESAPAPRQIHVATGVPEGQLPSAYRSLFVDLGHELRRLPSKRTAITLAVGGALALAVHPADRVLTERASRSRPLDHVFEFGESSGSGWTQAGAAIGTFVVGHATGSRRVQEVGADLVQAQILTSAITQGIKVSVGRRRPDDSRFSFPSGHASGTFATATVLSRHFGWKVGIPAYGLAAYVGGSRLQENRHYASDVIFGAAVGILAGQTVTVGHGASRFALSPVAVPGGAAVMLTHVS